MTDRARERPEDMVAICSRYTEGQILHFLDDQFGHCEQCQHAIHFRPAMAQFVHKLCMECAAEKFLQLPKEELPEIRVLPETLDDLRGYFKARGD